MTIVAVTFVNYLGGSVLPAIIIHGTLNTSTWVRDRGTGAQRDDIAPNLFWVTQG